MPALHEPPNAVGIDLGTTNSVLAWIDPKGVPESVASEEGDRTTPSVVFFDRDSPIVGREAVKAAMHEPHRAVQFAKREVGKSECQQLVCGERFPPEVIEALVLQKLATDASAQLGPVKRCVVTVPAYFNEPRRKATQDAGRLAGLDVLDIINEPTAAAIAYGMQQGFVAADGQTPRRELVLVYDLGGGTFDATVMELDGSDYRTLATGGDVYLGGIDFNRRIVDHLGQQFVEEFGVDPREDPVGLQQLMAEAEDAKRALSARQQITVHFKHGEHRARFSLTREQFEGLAADLLHRTIFTVKRVMREAGLAAGEVPRILLVGGSTRMPMVREALQRELGVEVDRPLSPDEAVAHGAALYADLLVRQYDGKPAPMSIQNVSSHDLGVLATEPKTKRPRRKVQIPRNTRLPASGTHRFFTRAADQRSVHIPVIEGGDASGRNATPIGKCVVRDLPPGLPAHSPVDVVFQYAENGRLTVTGELPSVGLQATLVVERAAGMSEEQLTAWRERIVEGIQVPDAIEAAEAEPRPDESQADRKTEANVRFEFLCPNGHRLSAPRKKIGLEIDCPSCGEALIIPDPDLPGEAQETEPPEDAFAVDQSAEAEDSEAVGFELEIDEAVAEEALELPEGLPESEQSEAADDPDLNSFLKGLGEE